MIFGVREKLFLVSLILILLVGVTVGTYLENALRAWTEGRIEAELLRHARTVRELLEQTGADSIPDADPVADRLGKTTSARVTIILRDGRVIGDSELTGEEVRVVENHAGRPEVIAAMKAEKGVSRRFSTTVKTDLLYAAVPFGGRPPEGVARVAMPLTEVDRVIGELRLLLGIGAVLGLVTAVLMSGLASHLLTRTLRALVRHARAVSGRAGRKHRPREDEIAGLAGSFNLLAEELQNQMTALGRERDWSEAILECMSEGLVALDDQQRITLVNRAALDLFPQTDTPLGKQLPETLGISRLKTLIGDAVAGRPASMEFELTERRPPLRIMAHATPQRGSGGVVVVMHDITERRRQEDLRREFIANASHELRTPVSIIRANTETLLDGAMQDAEVSRRLLEALERNAERLGSLISELLDLSRLDAGHYGLELAPVRLVDVATHVLASMDQAVTKKGVSLVNELRPDAVVVADRKAVEQVLLNLLDNAVKYSPVGGLVTLRDRPLDTGTCVEVEDNGPGVPREHRARLFERFFRVDPGRSRDVGGTGLGLAIVKSLVEAMGGRVGMRLGQRQGSVFWIVLPAKPQRSEPEQAA